MRPAAYIGRVGGLAVALGIGVALATGYGCAPAWADTPDSTATEKASTTSETADQPSSEPTKPETVTSPEPKDDDEVTKPTKKKPKPKKTVKSADSAKPAKAPASKVAAAEVKADTDTDTDPQPSAKAAVAEKPVTSVAAQTLSATPQTTSAAVTTKLTTPPVPSLRPWPTAYDPTTVVTYVGGLVSSVVKAVLDPFAAGLPSAPTQPPTAWTLLAWVRRELFNGTPRVHPVVNPQQNGLVTGNIGAVDPDGDPLTYTVVGRPLNGGTLEVDQDGNFTYRPMNAMAAVGGTDEFTVVVSDKAAGLHVHGPMGLLKFVPILGNFINPGGGDAVAQKITVNVDPVAGVDLSFPASFHWGVAHAGFQAEGGPNSPVDPNSDWYKWVHDSINQLLGIANGVPENGPGTYVSYDSDAALAHDQLGMDTFRMSIEWSRIFPNSTASVDISDEGGTVSLADLQALDALANQAEVQHYRDVFDSLRAHNLEPLVSVNHFTLPTWVHDPITARPLIQLGLPAPAAGWLSPTTPDEFEKYAAYVAWKYGDQVDNWTTLNEPFPPVLTEFLAIPGLVPNWPPGVIRPDLASTFLVNEAKGHVAAYDAIHQWDTKIAKDGQPAAFVGFTNNMIPARPANPINPLDVQAANAWNQFYNKWFPNAVIDGWVDANFDGIKQANEIHEDFKNKVDFMGVQYYGSQPMQGFGLAPIPGFPFLQGLPVRCSASQPNCSDFNQPTDPGGFREVLELAASYGKPLWVTENGIADDEDTKRPSYIVSHIAVVQDLLAHGMDIRGYTYWSFVDNLEWVEGYDLQFGLYGSDPTTPELERTPKPASIAAISAITKDANHSLPLSVLAMYIPGLAV
ncbi:family 1 glycosylhydrolase [Mycobacterium sp. 3519A]|uniref:family 1 glycosylhydrolase n=1 Tax=Mycobacterium sp. 3519A TaxID=2057184 RepID=UPI000C7D65ED|nr:family 1 glycosylhydrolase [Mycobacterium sp. 3519A]